ncbi:patatin-like phospholipase family protein [Thermophilibacter provencensis]|uniref:Patatin family protein n=1 Tax=Thermophilibacter provencensis TaxID=1852386 RepID=A0ABT7V280_9ACTN|nr:patatin family protein [Thermophilibacter provencensis]MDM8270712.1 patatin family protein [Thermophilibacter provencensis]
MPAQTQKTNVPALVLEGGGFRGMFTAGVLDVLQERGLTGFSSIWGVSAGAINGSNFRSRQIGRTMRDILAFRDDRRFMSLWSFATTGDIAGADFMYGEVQDRLDPCDIETFNESETPFYAVVSDVTFGTPDYLPVRSYPEDLVKVRASASLPTVSRVVEIDGHRYLDGGTTDSIPFETAMGLPGAREVEGHIPAERALVVLTRDRDYVRGDGSEAIALKSHRYDAYPYYLEALRTRGERYNAQREHLWELEREGRCLVIAPEGPVTVGSSTRDGESLLTLYVAGRRQAEARLAEIDAFLCADC